MTAFAIALALVAIVAGGLWASAMIAWWGAALAVATMTIVAGAARLGLVDHPHDRLGPANLITLARAIGACVLIALLAAPPGLDRWALMAVAGILVSADGLDGWLARRSGLASRFGARFDMEIDALVGLTLAALLATQAIVGPWVLLVGLPRYLFVAAGWLWAPLRAPLPPSERRRVVCVIQNGALALAFAPALPAAMIAALALAAVLWSFAIDIAWLIRHRGAAPSLAARFARARGLAWSLLIYHGIPGRAARLRRFYAPFVPAGGLAFDIGAHAGNRVRAWRRLGARVVAVEPQPLFARVLAKLFGRDRGVILVAEAVDETPGTITLHLSALNPTLATIAEDFIAGAAADRGFAGVTWEDAVSIPATTLDALIARHGRPDFIKIDVEGAEARVLAGLTQAVPALSFEFVPAARDAARLCLERVARLGAYRFNWSFGESHVLALEAWVDADAVRAMLDGLKPGDRSGDIYARRG